MNTKKTNISLSSFSPAEKNPVASDSRLSHDSASYEVPVTTRSIVQTEGSFCGSIPDAKPDKQGITTSPHNVTTDFTDTNGNKIDKDPFDFSEGTWN